jgi:hypothetical protein
MRHSLLLDVLHSFPASHLGLILPLSLLQSQNHIFLFAFFISYDSDSFAIQIAVLLSRSALQKFLLPLCYTAEKASKHSVD